jgi:hypothetical protein
VARRRPVAENARDLDQAADQLLTLGKHIQQRYGVRLGMAILDTVAATFDLEDEDKASEVAKALKKMRALGEKFGGLVMPVHHYGKTATTGLRGSSGWRAGADVVLSAIAERKESTGEITGRELALAKARDGIEGPISPFVLEFAELGTDDDGDPFGTCIVVPRLGDPPLSGPSAMPLPRRSMPAALRSAFAVTGPRFAPSTCAMCERSLRPGTRPARTIPSDAPTRSARRSDAPWTSLRSNTRFGSNGYGRLTSATS